MQNSQFKQDQIYAEYINSSVEAIVETGSPS